MDGARFANALARLQCSPADLSWRSGIDILSFGATKNGGALCDAIVVFNPEIADGLAVQLRRAGQVWSKMRFASAQLMAYIENGLWLNLAAASNRAAARIAAGIDGIAGLQLIAPVEANELFVELPARAIDALETDGFEFYRRSATLARFVCRFDVTDAEADALGAGPSGGITSAELLLRRLAAFIRQHAERAFVNVDQRVLLVEIVLVHAAQADHLAHDLGVEPVALGLGIDFLDIVCERPLFLFEPLNALDKAPEPVAGDSPNVGHGSVLVLLRGKGGLLLGARLFLVLFAPFVIGHAIDDLARLGVGQRDALLLGGGAIPFREAVAAEPGEVHQIDVLHIGAFAQM
jgi:hypothetical protein